MAVECVPDSVVFTRRVRLEGGDACGERHDVERVVDQVLIKRVAWLNQANSLGGRGQQDLGS